MMPPSVSCGAIFSSLIDPTQGASIGIFAPGPACLYAILGICQNTSSGILDHQVRNESITVSISSETQSSQSKNLK